IGWRIGKQKYAKSTKETEKSKAQKQLEELDALETARARSALTEEFYTAATGRKIEQATVTKFFDAWLADSESVTTKSTMHKYRQVLREFKAHTEAESKALLMQDVTVDHVAGFLADKRKTLAPGTIQGYKRILSSVFILAVNQGKIKGNPVALAKSR